MKRIEKSDLQKLRGVASSLASIGALIAIYLAFYLINPSFLNTFNLKNLLTNMAPLLVMACGATYVRLLGSLDLSMGAVCSCANVLLVMLMPSVGPWAYGVAILFGVATGFILGVIHTKLKIPSFIASLGMMNVYNSLALLLTPSPVMIAKAERTYIAWGKEKFGVVGAITIAAVIVMIVLHLVQKRTAMAGILLAIKLQSSAPTVGSPFTLQAVAAVLLGGTAMTGGKGSVLMTLVGVLIVTAIENGMTIIGVDAFWSQIVFGALTIVAMFLTTDRSAKNLIVK